VSWAGSELAPVEPRDDEPSRAKGGPSWTCSRCGGGLEWDRRADVVRCGTCDQEPADAPVEG
jgi:hypothetical protein